MDSKRADGSGPVLNSTPVKASVSYTLRLVNYNRL